MDLEGVERCATELRAGEREPGPIVDEVLPALTARPRLVRTRALEVATTAVEQAPEHSRAVVETLRSGIGPDAELTTREIEMLHRIADRSPRAMADCVQPLVTAITDAAPSDRAAAAATVLATVAAGEPGLLQGAVRPLVAEIDASSQSGRNCAWALRRLDTAEPAVTRPAVADAVWTLQDGDDTAQLAALQRLAQLGRIIPERIPDRAVDQIATLTSTAAPEVRAAAVATLGAIGGRPSEVVLELGVEFEGGGVFSIVGSVETDRPLQDDLAPLGTPAFDRLRPHLDRFEATMYDPEPRVRAASLDAVRTLGRERPEWLRSVVDNHRELLDAEDRSVRCRFVSILSESVRGAPETHREQVRTDLLRALGDSDQIVSLRAVAGFRAVLNVAADRDDPVLSAEAVRDALIARLLTSDVDLSSDLADAVADLHRENTIEIGSTQIDVVLDRFYARLTGPEMSVENRGGLAHFLAATIGEPEMAREVIERTSGTGLDGTVELDAAPVFQLLVENARGWSDTTAICETLTSAYGNPEEFDARDVRTELIEAFLDVGSPAPESAVDLIGTLVDELGSDSSPFWDSADAVDTIETVLIRYPRIAEKCRPVLYETAVDADETRALAEFRLFVTACLAAPPAGDEWRRRLNEQLDNPELGPESHAWLAGAVLVCGTEPDERAYAKRRLLSAITQGESNAVAGVVERICATTGVPPTNVAAELAVDDPKRTLEALLQSPSMTPAHRHVVTRVVREVSRRPADGVRAVFDECLDPTAAADAIPPTVLSEYGHAFLRFGRDEFRESLLSLLRSQADECGRERLTVDAATLAAVGALRSHPASRVRETATALHERMETESRAGEQRFSPATESSATSNTRSAAAGPRLLKPAAVRRLREELLTTGADPPAAVVDSLKITARDGDPPGAVGALRTLRTLLRTGRVDWGRIDDVVVTQVTDPNRRVRQIAARGLLTAARLADSNVDRSFVVERLTADAVASGTLARLLALSPPSEWKAPSVAADALITALFESPTVEARHACGSVFRELVAAAPEATRAALDSGLDLLDDGRGDALSTYHLLLAFGDQIEEHGRLAGSRGELVSAVVSDASQTVPRDWDSETGLVRDEATTTRPIELATVWRAALRVAAVGGLSVYKRALDPPDDLADADLVTVESTRAFLRNGSDQAVDECGAALLRALSQSELDRLVRRWTADAFASSTELARREVSVLPTFASVDRRADENARRYLDVALAATERDDGGIRKVGVESLSELTEQGILSARAFTTRLIAHVNDPSGWVRRRVGEELATHVSRGHLSDRWFLEWAERELNDPGALGAQTAAMAVGALGAAEARHRRDCLALVDRAYETGQPILDSRLIEAADRLVAASPGLSDHGNIGRTKPQAAGK